MKSDREKPVFEDHIGLLKSIVSRFDRSVRSEDSDLFPVACIGMIRAISTFDPSKSSFSYWATKIIRNDILKELKRESPTPVSFLDDCVSTLDRELPLDLIPELTEDCGGESESESEDRRMFVRHYMDGVPMAEIAREVGFTRERIRQRVNKAIESIRSRHKKAIDDHPFWIRNGNS